MDDDGEFRLIIRFFPQCAIFRSDFLQNAVSYLTD